MLKLSGQLLTDRHSGVLPIWKPHSGKELSFIKAQLLGVRLRSGQTHRQYEKTHDG